MKSAVAITGGYGYLGGRFAEFFSSTGHDVRLLARRASQRRPAWSHDMAVAELNLDDIGALTAGFRGADTIVHLAAMNASACAEDPAAARRVNVEGTRNVIRAAGDAGVSRLIYMSTAHVYGAPLVGNLNEASPPGNPHPYAQTHLDAEAVVTGAETVDGIVFRLSNAVGAPMGAAANCWMLVANDLCRQAAMGDVLTLRSSGEEPRDFIPISEANRIVGRYLGLNAVPKDAPILNLAAGTSMRTLDLAHLIADRAKARTGRVLTVIQAPRNQQAPAWFELSNDLLSTGGVHIDGNLENEIDRCLDACEVWFGHAEG